MKIIIPPDNPHRQEIVKHLNEYGADRAYEQQLRIRYAKLLNRKRREMGRADNADKRRAIDFRYIELMDPLRGAAKVYSNRWVMNADPYGRRHRRLLAMWKRRDRELEQAIPAAVKAKLTAIEARYQALTAMTRARNNAASKAIRATIRAYEKAHPLPPLPPPYA